MSSSVFKPCQIVCLDNQQHSLYGEVIQVIETRQLCWMRPLLLAEFNPTSQARNYRDFEAAAEVWDVRLTADVAYPLPLFRPALDMEVLPLMVQLGEEEIQVETTSNKQKLQHFLQKIWQENSNYF